MAQISLRNINKIYGGGSHAVRDLSLEIADGEFTVLVGPSGCGKSTLLRMIAGLEEISFGEMYIDGELVNELSPKDRGVAMVFQNYALFPHMTVFDNIAFGLKVKKTDRDEIKKRVEEAAEILGVTSLLTRKPAQLSGGQKQRVALGRALVSKPRIFLLDEPLSNLDAKLRASMRSELIKLHRRLNTTFIYVTHDQTEALTMGTKIVALKDGVLQQADSPRQIYAYPKNLFTAMFIGSPQMNIFPVELRSDKKGLFVTLNDARVDLPIDIKRRLADEKYIGKKILLGVRHERMRITDDGAIEAKVVFYEPLGGSGIVGVDIDGVTASVDVDGKTPYSEGQTVRVDIETARVHMFDETTELSLLAAPAYNYLKAKVEVTDGKLTVSFAGQNVVLDKYDHIVDEDALKGDVLFALGNREAADGDISVELDVDYVCTQQDKAVVYGTTVSNERVIFECAKGSEYMVGKKATVRFKSGDCTLCDGDGNRLLSAYPSRGRMRELYVKQKGKRGAVTLETLKILADEKFNDGWLLYCGDDDDHFVVKAPSDYPVYATSKVKVIAR